MHELEGPRATIAVQEHVSTRSTHTARERVKSARGTSTHHMRMCDRPRMRSRGRVRVEGVVHGCRECHLGFLRPIQEARDPVIATAAETAVQG